jgi:hypothetical protein
MPYMLDKEGGKCVHKKNSDGSMGARMKCYDNAADAKAYLGALNANVSDAKKSEVEGKIYRPFTQEETGYIPLHVNPAQACANCRFFHVSSWGDEAPYCHIVEGYPEPILATGWCNEWRISTPMPEPEPIPVVIVADELEIVESKIQDRIGQLTEQERRATLGWLDKMASLVRGKTAYNLGFKISDDGNRWEALYTNNWRDNDRELFPEAAIDRFIMRVKTGDLPWPELQYAHLSGLNHGVADNLIRIGHHVLATGTFDQTELAAKLKAHGRKCVQQGKTLALSHRFWFNPNERTPTGEFGDFETFEISWFEVLPGVTPANPFTLMEFKSMNSNIPPELIENVAAIVGGDKRRAEELITLSLVRDQQAIAERRDSKTEKPEQKPDPKPAEWESKMTALQTNMDTAVKALETAGKTFTDTGAKLNERLTALESDMKTLKDQAAKRQEIAPPGSRNGANRLEETDRIAEFLTQQESKTGGDDLSLVEFALGMKVKEVAPPQIIPGGN